VSGGSSSNNHKNTASTRSPAAHKSKAKGATGGGGSAASGSASSGAPPAYVYLSLEPTARVSVCLLGDGGRRLIHETELLPGEPTHTYRARRFELKLGNNSVVMRIDGSVRTVPPSSEPIAYAITKAYGRKAMSASRFPPCT
jgi:hypothetical protein